MVHRIDVIQKHLLGTVAGSLHQKRSRDLSVKIGGKAPFPDVAADVLPFFRIQLPASERDSFHEYRVVSQIPVYQI